MNWLQLVFYFAVVVTVVGCLIKAIRIARMPLHVRWELYPIPHEKGKEHYGGSYFEEINWWTKPRQIALGSELAEMGREILAIQSLFRNNRKLWYFSFPFHFGLYLLTATIILLPAGAILQALGIEISGVSDSLLGKLVYGLTILTGAAGWVLGAIGAFGLFLSRIFRRELRKFSVRADYFNLLLLLAVFLTGFFSWLGTDSSLVHLRSFACSLILFKTAPPLPAITQFHLILVAVFLVYLPFTHMTHFIGKYFTYHNVRWEDEPNIRGSKIEAEVTRALGYKLTWAAPHIGQNKTWAEAASETGGPARKEEAK